MNSKKPSFITAIGEKLTSFEVGSSALMSLLVMVILRIADPSFREALTPLLSVVCFVGGTAAYYFAVKDWRFGLGAGALGLLLLNIF